MPPLAGHTANIIGGSAPVLPAVLLLLALLGPQEEEAVVGEENAVGPRVIPGRGHRLSVPEPLDLRGGVTCHLAVEGDGLVP